MQRTGRFFNALLRGGLALALLTAFALAPLSEARAQQQTGASVVINEFRLDGPNGLADEFVELINRTGSPFTVKPIDDSEGWSVVNSAGEIIFIIPTGTVIPAGGTYTGAHEFSSAPGTPDEFFKTTTPTNSGIALFATTNPKLFTAGAKVDAVGSSAEPNRLYAEGNGYEPFDSPVTSTQYSMVRARNAGGAPQDFNENSADFVRVSTTGRTNNLTAVLGSSNVDSSNDPFESNSGIKASLLDPRAASTAAPNRVRSATPVENGKFGTLAIRRKYTNNTTAHVSQLRFRVVDITTLGSPGYDAPAQADVRVLTSSGLQPSKDGTPHVLATFLLDAEAHKLGGGYNSLLGVKLPGGLAPGASVNVEFLLGVERPGSFRFLVSVESLQEADTIILDRVGAGANLK